jgi:hypothetical protein
MFEHKSEPLLTGAEFVGRMAGSAAVVLAIVVFSLFFGTAGYHYLGDLPWIDSLLNASMILGGMGPVDPIKSSAAKLFATFYALYSGIAFLTMTAILMAPLVHRLLHTFHLEVEDGDKDAEHSDDADTIQKPKV